MGVPIAAVGEHRAVRALMRPGPVDLLGSDAPLLSKHDGGRDSGLPTPGRVLGPRLRQVEVKSDAEADGLAVRFLFGMNLDEVHEGLAVVHAFRDAAVLPSHPWALLPLLDEGDVVEHEDPLRGAKLLDHPVEPASLGRAPAPRRVGDERLDRIVLGGGDPGRGGLHALGFAGEEEAEGVLEGASAPPTFSRGISKGAADADLLDVGLMAGQAGALSCRGARMIHAPRNGGRPASRYEVNGSAAPRIPPN